MKRYVTFLYQFAEGRVVPGSVSREPDPRQPDSAQQWKIVRDVGKVVVIGQVDGKTRVIANARWRDGVLEELEPEHVGTPSDAEWHLLETALRQQVEDVPPPPGAEPVVAVPPAATSAETPAPAAAEKRPPYITFHLDLAAVRMNRTIPGRVAYAPTEDPPRGGFVWKIICDSVGTVIVTAEVGGKPKRIATARWREGRLKDLKQSTASTPTEHQWGWIEAALTAELAKPEALAARSDVVEDVESLERKLDSYDQTVREAEEPEATVKKRAEKKSNRELAIVIGAAVAIVAVFAIRSALRDQDRKQNTPSAQSTVPPVATAPKPVPPVVSEPVPVDAPEPLELRVARATSFAEAIALAKPAMTDSTDLPSPGAELLAHYARPRWADFDVPAETSIGHVQKDPDAERGKRMCVEGVIESITRRDLEKRKTYVGQLRGDDGDAVVFLAVGTTGELIKRARAKFCGVVIGTFGIEVSLVGMFDLPENRTPIVEQ